MLNSWTYISEIEQYDEGMCDDADDSSFMNKKGQKTFQNFHGTMKIMFHETNSRQNV